MLARRPDPSRRTMLRSAGLASAVGAIGLGGYQLYRAARPEVDPRTVIPLYSETVAMGASGQRVLVGGPGVRERNRTGTRLLSGTSDDAEAALAAQRFRRRSEDWLRDVPVDLAGLADSALRDLWVLSEGLPAPVAAWSPYWRFIWPRDAAFCAVALARTGHADRAVETLVHLQSLQTTGAWFEARYVPGTREAPDGRPPQFDGTGLLLWAAREVLDEFEGRAHGRTADRLAPLIEASQDLLLDATRDGERMPPVSPDYWERRERSVTLGVMACTLAGLRAAAALTGESSAIGAAESFTELLSSSFGAEGFQRYHGRGGADSARAFLDATGCHGVVGPDQLTSLRTEIARPGGGIAPGAAWRDDGISWTPSTTLLGLALARAGEADEAREILRWVEQHRTDAGSIPEKVLFDGRPAAVAPLAWSAANVILTIDALR